jgi:hypothetical protein
MMYFMMTKEEIGTVCLVADIFAADPKNVGMVPLEKAERALYGLTVNPG